MAYKNLKIIIFSMFSYTFYDNWKKTTDFITLNLYSFYATIE